MAAQKNGEVTMAGGLSGASARSTTPDCPDEDERSLRREQSLGSQQQQQQQRQSQERNQKQGPGPEPQAGEDAGAGSAAARAFSEDDFPPPPGFKAKPAAKQPEGGAPLGRWSARIPQAATWLAAAQPTADGGRGGSRGDAHGAGQAWTRGGPAEQWPHAGRGPRRAGPAAAWVPKDSAEPGAKIKVPQSIVGFVIGKQGKVLQSIKDETGATIEVDQSTKEQGFSTVHVRKGAGAARAKEMVEALLRKAGHSGAAGGDGKLENAELEVEQRFVGLLIGKGGENINRIKEESGAFVCFQQENSWQGYSTLRISGRPDCVERAKSLVDDKLAELQGVGAGAEELELRVEQRFVGSLIGRAGETISEIKAQSGAIVQFDQETAWRGYSILRVSGSGSCVRRATSLIDARLAELKAEEPQQPGRTGAGREARGSREETMELLVEHRFVGSLIGKGGETINGVKESSGASVSFDREPPHKGFGLLRVTGSAESVAKACALVDEKLAKLREEDA